MKILISTPGDISKNDGTTVRAKRILKVLGTKFDVKLLGSKKFALDIQIIRRPLRLVNLVTAILRFKFDCVYCSQDRWGFVVFKIFQKIFKYKIIYEAHSIVSEECRNVKKPMIIVKWAEYFERFIASHSYLVIALSKNTFDFFIKCNENIELIPVFLDTKLYKLNEMKRVEIRQRYKISSNIVVGLIGPFNIVFNKHFLTFLYDNISRFDKRIKFMIIGNCDKRIESERIIYAGYVEDYIDHLSSLDCVLVPSKIATGGPLNKILESMSLGLAVFTTPAGLVGLDYVTPGKDIFVFEEHELVDKMQQLMFEGTLIHQVGKNARHTVEVYYSKEVNTKKLTKLFGVGSYVGY